MATRPEGHVIILSEADVELLARRLHDLSELVMETLTRRRVALRAPHRARNAKILPLGQPYIPPQHAPLDDLF